MAKVAGTDKAVAITKLAREALQADAPVQGRNRTRTHRDRALRSAGTFSNACHVAIVDVDVETGM
jgi:carbon-monoxide dehydrogenase large subunit